MPPKLPLFGVQAFVDVISDSLTFRELAVEAIRIIDGENIWIDLRYLEVYK